MVAEKSTSADYEDIAEDGLAIFATNWCHFYVRLFGGGCVVEVVEFVGRAGVDIGFPQLPAKTRFTTNFRGQLTQVRST